MSSRRLCYTANHPETQSACTIITALGAGCTLPCGALFWHRRIWFSHAMIFALGQFLVGYGAPPAPG